MKISLKAEKLLNFIEEDILSNKEMDDREKLQSWVWVYSSFLEKRLSEEDLAVLAKHIRLYPDFFKKLIRNLSQIHAMMEKKDRVGLTAKMQEAVNLLKVLEKIENLN